MTPERLGRMLSPSSPTQWPDFDSRLRLTRKWGQWLLGCDVTPEEIVRRANRDSRPLKHFLDTLRTSPFGEDPMMKKAVLLALVLFNRPERYLRVSDGDEWPAIVDYHLMRVSLRMGIVEIGREFEEVNRAREWTTAGVEYGIREATRVAVELLTVESGLTHGQIDNILWQARGFCPEMKKPDCEQCLFSSVCEQRVELFQPIIRTTSY